MSEFTKIGGGHTRRASLMYPTDLWPNGVEIPLEQCNPIIQHDTNYNSTNPNGYTWNGVDYILIPFKEAVVLNIKNYGDYPALFDKDLKAISFSFNPDGTIPVLAKYFGCMLRDKSLSNRYITFAYLDDAPDNGVWEYGKWYVANGHVINENFTNWLQDSFAGCHGASKIKFWGTWRGNILWYGEDKNYLFARGYGGETYDVPEGAYYFKYNGYCPAVYKRGNTLGPERYLYQLE